MNAIKRLGLGILLLAVTSAILLLTDRGNRAAPGPKTLRVAILQHANTPVLDDGVRGVIDGLAARGFHYGDRIVIERFNAQGDMPTGIAIARQVTFGIVVTKVEFLASTWQPPRLQKPWYMHRDRPC